MSLQVSVKDLLLNLYQNHGLIALLFGQREPVTVNSVLNQNLISDEQYRKLLSLEIIYEQENLIYLNEAVISMFESFMDIGDVTPGHLNDYISELKRYFIFYQDTRELRFLNGAKKYIKKINTTLNKEIIKLQKNIDETYKNESNYRIKLQKLEDYRLKRDMIIDFIKKIGETLNQSNALIAIANNAELNEMVATLKRSLIENFDFLIEIQTHITEFINKIQHQLDVYKKVQKIKELKDHGALLFKTNFKEIVNEINNIKYNGYKAPKTKIAVDYLYSDSGYAICKRVADKYKLSRFFIRGLAQRMPKDFKILEIDKQVKLDTEKLVNRFLSQTKDNLFEYLIAYDFPKAIGNVSLEERLSLFVEIAMEYQNKLNFKYRLQYYDYLNEAQEKKKLGYTLILSK